MAKYLVAEDTEYYPWVKEFDTLKEASECYDNNPKGNIYLAKIIKSRSDE